MTTLATLKTVLEADATLLATATGGVWSFDETGRLGLNRSNAAAAAAFTSGIIKPCVFLRAVTDTPFGDIADDAAQVVSMREVVSVMFYQDGGFTTIETMMARVFTLLHGKQFTGTFVCRHALDSGQLYDTDLDASVRRSDYAVIYKRN